MTFRCGIVVGLLLVGSAIAGTNTTIVVSAPRLDDLDLMAVDTAADVTVLDRAAIEQSGAVSVPELLRNEANVLIRGTSGGPYDGQISMRGFGESSQTRTLVVVDGHKFNRPDLGGIEWNQLPLSNIDRVEVIRGGQNVLYGNHALSGVVKITTKRAEDSGVNVSGTIGSFGYVSGLLAVDQVYDAIDFRVGIDHYAQDGFRSNSASRATVFSAMAGWYPNNTDSITLRGSIGKSYQEFAGPITEAELEADPTQSSNSGDSFSDDDSGLASLIYETERLWGAARITTGIDHRERQSDLSGRFEDSNQTGLSLAPRMRYGEEDSYVMAGVDLFYNDVDVEQFLSVDRNSTRSWGEFERITVSPYVFGQRTLDEKNVINGGVRYEHASTDNLYVEYEESQLRPLDNRGNPNPNYKNPPDIDPDASYEGRVDKEGWAAEISFARQFTEWFRGWAGYDRVYRYPTLDEVAAYQGFPLSDNLNENLDPETGHNVELGTQYANRNWDWSVTGFLLLLDNEIAFDTVQNLNRNLNETRRIGVETELVWQQERYGASTRWAFVDARFVGGDFEGNQVPLVPWGYGVFSAWYELVEGIRFTGTYSYVGEQYRGNDDANSLGKMNPYGLLGFRLNATVGESATVFVSVENLTDEVYALAAFGNGFYPGAGRSFRAGISKEF